MMRPARCLRAGLTSGILLAMPFGGTVMADTSALLTEVAAVFDAVRGGDLSRVGKLVAHGDSIIPAVAPLLQDPNATVRREAVALLDAIDSKAAAQTALQA